MSAEKSRNQVRVSGFLSDAKRRSEKLVTFSLALCYPGKKAEETHRSYLRCVAFKGLGERVLTLPAESKVYIAGRLNLNRWDDKGTLRYEWQLVADEVETIPHLGSTPLPETTAARPIGDEDIPF